MAKEKLDELIIEIRAELKTLKKDLEKTEKLVKTQGKKMSKQVNSEIKLGISNLKTMFNSIGAKIAGITAGVFAIGSAVKFVASSFKTFREFDKGLRNVNSIINVSEEQLKKYGNQLRVLQSELGASGKDLTDAFYQTVSAGVKAGEAIKFVAIASKAAVAGVSSVKVSVDALTTVLNAFHLDASKASEVSDILFQTVKRGKTTFEELAASLSTIAPIAAASGISFNEIGAAFATLTKQGTPAAVAATQIRASIVGLNEKLGDGWTKTKTYNEGLQELYRRAKGSQNALKEMLGRVEGVNAVLGQTGKNAKMAAEDIEAFNNVIGATQTAFNAQAKSVDFQIKQIEASYESLQIAFIQAFGDSIITQLRKVGIALKEVSGASGEVRKAIKQDMKSLNIVETLRTIKDLPDAYIEKEKALTANIIKDYQQRIKDRETLINKIRLENKGRVDEQLTNQLKTWRAYIGTQEFYLDILNNRNKYLEQYKKQLDEVDKKEDESNKTTNDKIVTIASLREEIENLQNKLLETNIKDTDSLLFTKKQIDEKKKQIEDIKKKLEELSKAPIIRDTKLTTEETKKLKTIQTLDVVKGKEDEGKNKKELKPVETQAELNEEINFTDDLLQGVGESAQLAAQSLITGWSRSIRLFKQADSMAQQFLNTLIQIALQQAALALVKIGFSQIGIPVGRTGGTFVNDGISSKKMATGGNFIVPSGFENDSFPVFLNSGESVSVNTKHETANLTKGQIKMLESINSNLQQLITYQVSEGMKTRQAIRQGLQIDGLQLSKTVQSNINNLENGNVNIKGIK